jgi:RNA polymerase sigma-70 factor (ECF subfamily)
MQLATYTTETETALVIRAQKGDRNAFGELVRQHHPGVVNVVYRMCGDVALAEDAAQDAFIQAWLHLPTFRPGTSLRNWLYRIAVNAALDALRREPKTPFADVESLSMPDPLAGPEAIFLQKERALIVQRAILALAETSRAVLILREYGGLSYQEIAFTLDIPLGTVMSRLNYARERLKEILVPQFLNLELENV